jgi:hypothetical protein
MRGYLKDEKCAMFWGIIFLFGACLSDFTMPIFVGWAIDHMGN